MLLPESDSGLIVDGGFEPYVSNFFTVRANLRSDLLLIALQERPYAMAAVIRLKDVHSDDVAEFVLAGGEAEADDFPSISATTQARPGNRIYCVVRAANKQFPARNRI